MLHYLPKSIAKSKKRLGRGIGSGRGKTAARGTKGQKSRGRIPLSFIGGSLPLYKKLPFRRGLGNTKVSSKLRPVGVEILANLKTGTEVTLVTLMESNLITRTDQKSGIKLVGSAKLKNKLVVKLPTTKSAKESIEQAGGEVR